MLAFIARRVELEPIIVLVACRDEPTSRVDELGLPELRLDALDQASAMTLLDTHARGLAPDLRERLLDDAAGNPLALVELPNALDSEEPVGALAATAPLPITERLERAFGAGRRSFRLRRGCCSCSPPSTKARTCAAPSRPRRSSTATRPAPTTSPSPRRPA